MSLLDQHQSIASRSSGMKYKTLGHGPGFRDSGPHLCPQIHHPAMLPHQDTCGLFSRPRALEKDAPSV